MKTCTLAITVNGERHDVTVKANMLLVELLRQTLALTGTHVGCDTSQCGACTVHLDGRPVKACSVFASQLDGHRVDTIEGLAAPDGTLHPMQAMFKEHHGLQCGFCTPGMIMSAIGLVQSHPGGLSEADIRAGLEGNFCRCTGYNTIVRAIQAASLLMQDAAPTRAAAGGR